MSQYTNYLKQKQISIETCDGDFTPIIWSELTDSDFNQILSDLLLYNPDYDNEQNQLFEVKWEEFASEFQNQSNFNQNLEIPLIDSEIIEPNSPPQTKVNSPKSTKQTYVKKSQKLGQSRKKALPIIKLHEDLYEEKPLKASSFFKWVILITVSFILTGLMLQNRSSVIAEKIPMTNQLSVDKPLNPTQNVLDTNNNKLAQIPHNSSQQLAQPIPQPPKLHQNNLKDKMIVDRYYFPQNNSNQNPQMMIVDRYYLAHDQLNQMIIPQTESLIKNNLPIKVNSSDNYVTNNQVLPPPPPPQLNSSIPTFTPKVNTPDLSQTSPSNGNQNTTYTLQGMINFGEYSAALFKNADAIVRINQGEAMGNNGWILAKIDQEMAILTKNGEIKTLKVGESVSILE